MVLILVLMEDTLREMFILSLTVAVVGVLILVLMEDTLRDNYWFKDNGMSVLILVLMEDTLRAILDMRSLSTSWS